MRAKWWTVVIRVRPLRGFRSIQGPSPCLRTRTSCRSFPGTASCVETPARSCASGAVSSTAAVPVTSGSTGTSPSVVLTLLSSLNNQKMNVAGGSCNPLRWLGSCYLYRAANRIYGLLVSWQVSRGKKFCATSLLDKRTIKHNAETYLIALQLLGRGWIQIY